MHQDVFVFELRVPLERGAVLLDNRGRGDSLPVRQDIFERGVVRLSASPVTISICSGFGLRVPARRILNLLLVNIFMD
jgi:hypothetical protein